MTAGRGVFWPLVLIAVGLVFLLANLGFVPPVSLLSLLGLWPLLLVLAGIDMAFARRWPIPALAAEAAIIVLGLTLAATQPTALSPMGWVSFAIRDGDGQRDVAVPRAGAQSLRLRLNAGAGTFTLGGGSSALVESHSDGEDLRLRRSDRSGDRADIRLDQGASGGPRIGGRATASVDTRIASDVPTSLDLNVGAGQFLIDLRDVRVTDARINAGASSLELVLPKPSGEVSFTVNAGASNVVVVVPEGVDARVTATGAITSLRSDNPRMATSGSTAESSGYASSRDRVTVRVTAGASPITIR